jgi:protein TonB
VKYFQQNSTLTIAIAFSVLAHAGLLAVRFVAPDSFKFTPTDPGLEVILVNAKHDKKPIKADALAQADLDGGGNADTGRSKSPLPDLRKTEDGDSLPNSQRRISELEEQQLEMLTRMKKDTSFKITSVNDQLRPDAKPDATDADETDSSRSLARMAAEITQTIEDQNKRPRKTFITPSTRAVGYAQYYKAMQKRVEDIGTLNFPRHKGKKLYGELIVYIPIFQDGSIYEKEGGAHIEKSSGIPALDRAALRIVKQAAPFGAFPPKMLSNDKDDLWVVITSFKFGRDNTMHAELHEGKN